ncbi:MAG: hypothetical protein HND53_14150 [Proteobacteria bacterium]|nr:hypothetical protein [Pseudomonadota bacterium]
MDAGGRVESGTETEAGTRLLRLLYMNGLDTRLRRSDKLDFISIATYILYSSSDWNVYNVYERAIELLKQSRRYKR